MFGEYVREKRLALDQSLRTFCVQHGEDPSNWSKLERGMLPPPVDHPRLLQIARYLRLSDDEHQTLIDYAHADRGQIPADIRSDRELIKQLPIVFRTLRGDPPAEEELMALAEKIRKRHSGMKS